MRDKADKLYFENFVAAADCACNAAEYLIECLENFDSNNLKEMLKTLHGYETKADDKKHEMSAALAKAFVTPIDREDLALLSQNIDEVSDCIEEVLQAIYMYRIQKIPYEAIAFAKKISKCCSIMKEMLGELSKFKKSSKLHDMIVVLNSIEEECDEMYLDSTYKIVDVCTDPIEVLSWREIYYKMEKCADSCEHVGDCVDMVVMKNT